MEEDERGGAEIGPNPSPRPNPKVTQDQLSKFEELQRRRLQMKAKPKNKKKFTDVKHKLRRETLDAKGCLDSNTDQDFKDTSVSSSSKGDDKNEVSSSSSQVDVHPLLKKRKLHWGLDTKERWERKANM